MFFISLDMSNTLQLKNLWKVKRKATKSVLWYCSVKSLAIMVLMG